MTLSIILILDNFKTIYDYYDILIFIFCISLILGFTSILMLVQFFGNNLWKKQEEYNNVINEYRTKNFELNEMITKLGKHEAFKIINKTDQQ
jgi:hypothetical protein